MYGMLLHTVNDYNVTCSQEVTYLRHYFCNLSMEILCHSEPFCACRHHTVNYGQYAVLFRDVIPEAGGEQ
jgi:hypothetical protein